MISIKSLVSRTGSTTNEYLLLVVAACDVHRTSTNRFEHDEVAPAVELGRKQKSIRLANTSKAQTYNWSETKILPGHKTFFTYIQN